MKYARFINASIYFLQILQLREKQICAELFDRRFSERSETDSCRDVMHCQAPSPTPYGLAAQATGLRQNALGVCVEFYKLLCPHYHGRRCERIATLLSVPQGAEES